MPLGMDVGLSPRDFVLDEGPFPLPKKGAESPKFSAHAYCGQTAGCVKMPLGMQVGLDPGHIVLDEDPASPLPGKGTAAAVFSAHVYCGHSRISQLLLRSCLCIILLWL